MNIAFFITPKQNVAHIDYNSTVRQALEKMEYHRFTSVPVVDEEGKFVGTITEGDILWELKKRDNLDFKDTEKISIKDIHKHFTNKAVSIKSNIEDVILLAVNQNFVPVIDDQGIFTGIVKRSDIIKFCYNRLFNKTEELKNAVAE